MKSGDLWLRVRALLLRKRVELELREELDFHIEMQVRKDASRGISADDARSRALIKFGNAAKLAEECRDERRINLIDNLLQDLRYAIRTMRRSPGFTLVAVLTLAAGIGANAAIFSLVDAILLRPLPFHDPDRLVMVWEDQSQYGFPRGTPAPANFIDWKDQNHVFDDMAALDGRNFNISGDGDPERVSGLRVTANLLPLLGVKPIAGRFFLPEEDKPEAVRTVIVSYGLWRRRFGGDSKLVGRNISLNGFQHTVVGVMPPEFQFPSREAQLWIPAAFMPAELASRDSHYLTVVARLKTGISLSQAQAEMATIARKLAEQYPVSNKGVNGVQVVGLREQYAGSVRVALNVLLATVGAVLLIACANVAHLLLARGTARRKEIAVRVALGAGRARLIRQLLAESVLLAGIGAIVGVILSTASFRFLARLLPESFPESTHLRVDVTVLAFVSAIALFTTILFGLGPALQASRIDLNDTLKKAGRRSADAGNQALRSTLVIAEVALTVVLLVAAGLLVQSYSRVRAINPGFRAEGLLTVETSLSEAKYAEPSVRVRFYQQVLERIGALPGVTSAGYINYLPLTLKGGTAVFSIEGRPASEPGQLPVQTANDRVASPDYFRTMGIPLLRGRYFDERDGPDGPAVVVINETMARTFWSHDDPLGSRIKFGFGPFRPDQPKFTIIGVIGDVKQMGLDVPTNSEMYFPITQPLPLGPFSWPRHLVLRTTGNPMRLAGDVRRAILAVDSDQPVAKVRTMEDILDSEVLNRHTQMTLLSAFSMLALLLAAVGLYGVLCYAVAQRTSEIGLRMALGAQRSDVVAGIVLHALLLTLGGIALGLGGALAVTRVFRSLLFEVSPTDPATFATVALLLITVATVASYVPARRAATVDPVVALRHE